MKIVAIICEYNPFHTGHKYQIESIRKNIKDAHILCLMSGDFVQRGDVSIIDKHSRSKIAIKNGADLVLQFPTMLCTQVANIFSMSSISILNSLNCIDYLCFGSENGNIDNLRKTAIEIDNNLRNVKENLKKGNSYIKSVAMSNEIPNSSNDILSVEYIRALHHFSSNIEPITIKRQGNNYNDKNLGTLFSSATSIRHSLKNNEVLDDFLLNSDYFKKQYIKFDYEFISLIKYSVLSKRNSLKDIFEIKEGIENKIIENICNIDSFENLVMSIKSKRYTYASIRRMIFNILLDIKKDDIKMIQQKNYYTPYTRILAFNDRGRDIIKKIKENSYIEIINKISSYNPKDEIAKLLFDKDIYSSKIYNIPKKSYYYDDYKVSPIYHKTTNHFKKSSLSSVGGKNIYT